MDALNHPVCHKQSGAMTEPASSPHRHRSHLARVLSTFSPVAGHSNTLSRISLLIVGIALLLWLGALSRADLSRISDYGLVTALPWGFFVALGLLNISFLIVVQHRQTPTVILLAHVAALIFIIHGTTAILYEVPRTSWIYWLTGLTEYIQRNHAIDRALHVYFNWPGFFAFNALFGEIVGLPHPLAYASWAPAFFHLVKIGALLLILSTITTDRRVIWLAIWFYYATNWIGQDYLAPQSLNHFFFLLIIGITLRWFIPSHVPLTTRKHPNGFGWIPSWYHSLTAWGRAKHNPDNSVDAPRTVTLLTIVIILSVASAASHQLTPFMLIWGLTALVLVRFCRFWTLPLTIFIITLVWLLYVASVFLDGRIDWLLRPAGQVVSNIDRGIVDLSIASPGRTFVAWSARILTISIGILAILGFLRRLRAKHLDLAALTLILTPMIAPLLQSYGGEVLFRVYYFALPFAAFFAATLFYPRLSINESWLTTILIGIVSSAMLAGLCFSYYGNERAYRITRGDVAAAQFIYEQAPQGSQILTPLGNAPTRFTQLEHYRFKTFSDIRRGFLNEQYPEPNLASIEDVMRNQKYVASYILITRNQREGAALFNPPLAIWLDKLEESLKASPTFKVVYEKDGSVLFGLTDQMIGGTQ